MKIEAIKVENGFLIPMNDVLKSIEKDRILVELIIVDPPCEPDYSALDDIIGLCETNRRVASVHHDQIIYNVKKN